MSERGGGGGRGGEEEEEGGSGRVVGGLALAQKCICHVVIAINKYVVDSESRQHHP